MKRYCYICGYETNDENIIECPQCLCDDVFVSSEEEEELMKLSNDRKFTNAMIKLHDEDPIEYQLKMSQFKANLKQQKQAQVSKRESKDLIHCPKCGSTSITTGARGVNNFWGLLGASKTVNRCGNCGYTWKPNNW